MNYALFAVALGIVGLGSSGVTWASPVRIAATSPDSLKAAFYDAVNRKEYAQALRTGRRYLDIHPHDDVFALDYAYALLAAGRVADADQLLRALRNSPNARVASAAEKQLTAEGTAATPAGTDQAAALLQTAYDQSAKGDHAAAIVSLNAYLAAKPADDQARLQLGYELDAAGRHTDARSTFAQVATSINAEIAAKAKAALAAFGETSAAGRADRGSIYGYIIHDNRFADTFYGADLRYDLGASRIVPYVVAHLSNDTRSGVPGATEIFNDNALVLSAGAREALSKRLSAFAEAGTSIGLRGKQSFPELRYGLTYYAEFGSARTGHTALDASAVEYSRFANAISYASLTHDFPLAGPLRGVAGVETALDAHRLYYNNYAEAFAGLQLAIGKPAMIRLIHAYGRYFSRGIDPPESGYESTRAELLFGTTFK